MALHFVFERVPSSPKGLRMIEIEDDFGRSVKVGEWRIRRDGHAELVIPAPVQEARCEACGCFRPHRQTTWQRDGDYELADLMCESCGFTTASLRRRVPEDAD